MRLLLLEDNNEDARIIAEGLRALLRADVSVIKSEKEFTEQLEEIAKLPPDLIIIDIMLRWTTPARGMLVEDAPGEFHLAGFRCAKRLEDDDRTRQIPYIYYTSLEQNNFAEVVVHTKAEDLEPLAREIRRRLDARREEAKS
jgi:CheY-like chemotaxis protein